MKTLTFKMLFRAIIFFILIIIGVNTMANPAIPNGFVYLHDIDPNIIINMRYVVKENFYGAPVMGYKKNVAILTKEAASAITKAQQIFAQDGYNIVIYDAYRPQDSVDEFKRWSLDVTKQETKNWYYPRVDKSKFFELGYVVEKSSHTRGSTIDLSLIKKGEKLHPQIVRKHLLADGFEILLLDDGTVDMGTSFDLMDPASHYENNLVSEEHKKLRNYMRDIMNKCGFTEYPYEWWHFTLKNEPFPDTYFNFQVE
jgi:D-alanyl-D-alanine dipeptidase